jgi:hypothetical protein
VIVRTDILAMREISIARKTSHTRGISLWTCSWKLKGYNIVWAVI